MRYMLLIFFHAVMLAAVIPTDLLHAQSPPADFKLSVTAGGVAPWDERTRVTVDNTGQATYFRYRQGDSLSILADTTFIMSGFYLQQIWKTIQDSSFFSMSPAWEDTTASEGSFVKITVTANGATHEVNVRNIAQPTIQRIILQLNIAAPGVRLQYSPPENVDYTPSDPCNSSFGALRNRASTPSKIQVPLNPKLQGFPGPHSLSTSAAPLAQISHPGTVAACNVSLPEAVANGWATLSSKGGYFGDDVSITVKNRNRPPCNNISITFYLEFYGPLATEANIDKICGDITKKWAGATTSTGTKIEVGFVTRADPLTYSPPNSPGFNQIQLVPNGSARSYVKGPVKVNSGTGSGKWEVPGDPGLYAHEAGHLMGLPDRYVDYNKSPDGSWVNSKTGQSYPNDAAFAAYVVQKDPRQTVTNVTNFLKKVNVYGIPQDGSENDLMASLDKPLTQADIDRIAANPGLLVVIPNGLVFANRKGDSQNLIVVHKDDVYAGPGQTRMLNGIYAACIDHHKGIPSESGVFDVAPPVSEWSGIPAARYMARLLQYVDSMSLYCEWNLETQSAIWRISDNTYDSFGTEMMDTLFAAAGINLGDQLFYFPRLGGSGLSDSTSHVFLPTQLYVADIRPAFAGGQIGVATHLNVSLSRPSGAPAPSSFSWTATTLNGAAASINGSDSTASFTPAHSGVYEIGLQLSVNDSTNGQRTFTSDRKGYVIVPDDYTETFEHPGLTDKFPWKNMGNVPWKITSNNPQTGTGAAQPGAITSIQTSVLGIEVSLPADSVVIFSVRTVANNYFNGIIFSVDSVQQPWIGGGNDWTVMKYPVKAGRHLLTWAFKTFYPTPVNSVWLDNIFFPGNVVVTSAEEKTPDLPRVFALEQNYPNPFNPNTEIRFHVPVVSDVKIGVYDVLGREVAVLVNERKNAGRYEVAFDASRLSTGVYFYRMTAGDFVQTRKLTLLK